MWFHGKKKPENFLGLDVISQKNAHNFLGLNDVISQKNAENFLGLNDVISQKNVNISWASMMWFHRRKLKISWASMMHTCLPLWSHSNYTGKQ